METRQSARSPGGGWAEFRVPSLSTQLDERKSFKLAENPQNILQLYCNYRPADRGRFACTVCPLVLSILKVCQDFLDIL